jgi:predicted dehydrogenase
LLKANGCQVLGIDFDPRKLELAERFGATVCDLAAGQDPVAVAEQWTHGVGVDAVLITASTRSHELVHQAANMCRQRGRIVLVGVAGLNLQRADFYTKELSFQVSCSYGPGRYDPNYEQRGLDYPIGFVRWTEQRNFEAVLALMAEGKLETTPLVTHRFDFEDALAGYAAVDQAGAMGIVLQYDQEPALPASAVAGAASAVRGSADHASAELEDRPVLGETATDSSRFSAAGSEFAPHGLTAGRSTGTDTGTDTTSGPHPGTPIGAAVGAARRVGAELGIAFIGAGGFTTRMLLPLLPKSGLARRAIVSSSGVSAAHAAKKFGFAQALSDWREVLADDLVDAVFITTPHHMHAAMVCSALSAGKHVFVEKPLALTLEELGEVEQCMAAHPGQVLTVGFNRRFSPHAVAMREWLRSAPGNKAMVITVNAGSIPAEHWIQDAEIGGGRIIGEACHFIDLARYLAGCPIVSAAAFPVEGGDGRLGDCASIVLTFEDGSTATVHYLSNGSKDFPKERIEVFAGGKVVHCDNFRSSREIGGKRSLRTRKQDKGHAGELAAFFAALRDDQSWPIPAAELLEVSRVTLECALPPTDVVQESLALS